jgi:tRNA(Ile)-lysidine synthase
MQLKRTFDSAIQNLRLKLADKVVIACSGGRDSMCLLQLSLDKGLNLEVAHVNYRLRGKESDADEALVRDFCERHSIPCHVSNWTPDTSEHGSIQMQCRAHRYQFFEKVMNEHGLTTTFLAHHANDNVETVLLNLFNGTGINGLAGMPVQRDRYFRPLLSVFRKEIENYLEEFDIPFRDDVSNFESKYDRNFVRNELLPLIEKRFAGSNDNMVRSIGHLGSAKELLDYQVERLKPEYWNELRDSFSCNLSKLKLIPGHPHLLFSWLSPYGFNANQIDGILNQKTGAEFRSSEFSVVISRDEIIGEKIENANEELQIALNFENPPKGWTVEQYSKPEVWSPNQQNNVAEFDAEKLQHLQTRGWQEGDKFKPLGMNGWKKLSDFFIDEKLSILDKEKVQLLVSGDDIAWVIGLRMDDRFKVNKDTQTVLRLTYNPNS